MLAGVGGKVEGEDAGPDVLERAARREVAEEVGLDLTGIDITYVESTCFVTDDGDPLINVVFSGHLPATTSPEEAAALTWLTPPDLSRLAFLSCSAVESAVFPEPGRSR